MKQNNIHLVPQVVIDCAENLLKSTNPNMKDAYTLRLEAIRDYCDEVLKKLNTSTSKPTFTPVRKKKKKKE